MREKKLILALFGFAGFLIMACSLVTENVPLGDTSPNAVEATDIPATKMPAPTRTPVPTKTLLPTATLVPTPAAVGDQVDGGDILITVVDAYKRERIYPGGSYSFTPKAGYMIIDLGVRIQNKTPGNVVSIFWNQVGIEEDNGDAWYPVWGSVKYVSAGKEMDAMTIGISEYEVDGNTTIDLENDAYLRMIFIVSDANEQILFGIGNSPVVELTLRQ